VRAWAGVSVRGVADQRGELPVDYRHAGEVHGHVRIHDDRRQGLALPRGDRHPQRQVRGQVELAGPQQPGQQHAEHHGVRGLAGSLIHVDDQLPGTRHTLYRCVAGRECGAQRLVPGHQDRHRGGDVIERRPGRDRQRPLHHPGVERAVGDPAKRAGLSQGERAVPASAACERHAQSLGECQPDRRRVLPLLNQAQWVPGNHLAARPV